MGSKASREAAAVEAAAVEVAALGRPFSLGMLYDCRSDTLVPGKDSCVKVTKCGSIIICVC